MTEKNRETVVFPSLEMFKTQTN